MIRKCANAGILLPIQYVISINIRVCRFGVDQHWMEVCDTSNIAVGLPALIRIPLSIKVRAMWHKYLLGPRWGDAIVVYNQVGNSNCWTSTSLKDGRTTGQRFGCVYTKASGALIRVSDRGWCQVYRTFIVIHVIVWAGGTTSLLHSSSTGSSSSHW